MFNKYDPSVKPSDPEIKIRIPANILKDLVMRAQENGYSVENELAKRLARTLENDAEMITTDNDEAFKAFAKLQANPEFAIQVLSSLKQ